jgi:diguanylate cyclase (GGDEF)-like protein
LEEDIITDLTVLQDRLDKMINRVDQRDLALQQFQALQITLFTLNSLPEMIDAVLEQAKLFFNLGAASLALVNNDGKVAGYLSDTGYTDQKNQNLVLLNNRTSLSPELISTAFIGEYNVAKHGIFFHDTKQKPHDVIIIPLARHGEYLGSLNLFSLKAAGLPDKMKLEFVTQIGFSVSICLENHLNFAVARQAYRNEVLASANNRRFLEQRLVEELERGERATCRLSCLILDVAFPAMPDQQQNSQLEIQVLQVVAETIKRQLRVTDVFSYYEGKKFAAFLTNTPESVLTAITARLKTAIAEQVVKFANQIVPLTLSLGTASYPLDKASCSETQTHQEIAVGLISAADANLLKAKQIQSPTNKKITAV